MLALFGYGVVRLFYLRFEQGDIYPPYSSLRSDPLGTMAFYESLEMLNAVRVERNYQPLPQLKVDEQTTLLLLGISLKLFSQNLDMELVRQHAAAGGRVVVAFNSALARKAEPINKSDKPKPKQKAETETTGDSAKSFTSFKELGVTLGYGTVKGSARCEWKTEPDILPSELPWSSSLSFDRPLSAWRVIYAVNKTPVVMERDYGRGMVVFISDSYFFSNEALFRERFPGFLSWVIGDRERVLLDESHLGVYQAPGLATLARKYRLHGLVFGLALFSALFIWKSAMPLVPPQPQTAADSHLDAVGDNIQGLVNLLRRNIAPRQILTDCIAEWKKTCGEKSWAQKQSQIESIALASAAGLSSQDPVSAYNTIFRLISKRTIHDGN